MPNGSLHSHVNPSKNEEKGFRSTHCRKRPRSDDDVSEAGGKHPKKRPFRKSSCGIRGTSLSPRSELFNRSQGSASPGICVAVVENDYGQKYEKRPRHKTRVDKYELKVDKKAAEKTSHDRPREKSKRRRRKKTALSLNHDFRAPNIPQERLTLQPHIGPGIFHKGKASAPVERRGLPDLTFSEMNFLTKRRDVGDARHQRTQDVQPPKQKSNKDSAQEISNFFSRPEEYNKALQNPTLKVSGQREGLVKQSTSPNKSSPARHGVRKPLSMTSGNQARTGAFSTNSLDRAPLSKSWVPDSHIPTAQRYFPAKTGSSIRPKESSSRSSYYSWSATPFQKSIHHADLPGPSEVLQSVPRTSSYESRPRNPRKRDVSEVARRPSNQTSVSDRSLEHYTKHVLLGGDKQGLWDRRPRAVGSGGQYTLQDLKRLARLSELDDECRRSAVQFNQPRDAEDRGKTCIPLTKPDEREDALLACTGRPEGLEGSAVRSMASSPGKFTHPQKGDGFLNKATVVPAAPEPQLAQSGRQGARPADHQSLRDSLQLDNLRFTPDRVAWLLSTNAASLDAHGRKTVSENAELAVDSPQVPLWRTHDSVHRLGRYQQPAEPTIAVSYSEPSLTHQIHFPETIGPVEPVTKPRPFQLDQEDLYWVEHETLEENHDAAHKNTLWDGQDDFDRALLQEPCSKNTFDPSPNMLGNFDFERAEYLFADPGTTLPHVAEDLAFGDDGFEATGLDHNISNTVARPAHSEEDIAAGVFVADGLLRNRMLGPNLIPGKGHQEDEEQFTGFARPHVLY